MVTDHVIKIGVGGLLEGDKKEKKEAEVKEFRGESRESYQSFIQKFVLLLYPVNNILLCVFSALVSHKLVFFFKCQVSNV